LLTSTLSPVSQPVPRSIPVRGFTEKARRPEPKHASAARPSFPPRTISLHEQFLDVKAIRMPGEEAPVSQAFSSTVGLKERFFCKVFRQEIRNDLQRAGGGSGQETTCSWFPPPHAVARARRARLIFASGRTFQCILLNVISTFQ
jgi:hypothetical protein